MWPFKESRRIEGLEEDIRKLRRDLEGLELEWAEVYDKLRRTMGRIVKSRAVIEAKEAGENEPANPDGGDGSAGLLPGLGGFLTPRQKQIQQQILRRRGGQLK